MVEPSWSLKNKAHVDSRRMQSTFEISTGEGEKMGSTRPTTRWQAELAQHKKQIQFDVDKAI